MISKYGISIAGGKASWRRGFGLGLEGWGGFFCVCVFFNIFIGV